MGSFIDQAPCRDCDPWLFDQTQMIWRNQRWHIVSAVLFGKSVNL
jgi:hypothetical protein